MNQQAIMAEKLTADILAALKLPAESPHGPFRSVEWIEVHHLVAQAIHEAVIYGIMAAAAARATGETAVPPSS